MNNAVRLALERELVLRDVDSLGHGREAARYALTGFATRARALRPLNPAQASYVRNLSRRRPECVEDLAAGLEIVLPERLLTRAEGAVCTATFDAMAIREMVAWELAAVLEGRTMAEWALNALIAARAAS
jgi:hypothetical protein